MRTSFALLIGAATLFLVGCSPKSDYRNFATPENAVRTLLEAARVQDKGTQVDALVERERVTFETSSGQVFTFTENGEHSSNVNYTIGTPEFTVDRRAQVPVTLDGMLTFTFPCELEQQGWRVSMLGFRQNMMDGSAFNGTGFSEHLQRLDEHLEKTGGMPAPR